MGQRHERASVPAPARRFVYTAGFAVAFLFWWGMCQTASAAHFIDYLYVEANEGDSSGGHAAIRFENRTYHFQHENPGIIHIRCFDSAAFEHAYAMLGNRTIRESRITVSDETYTLLSDAFAHLVLIQDAQLDVLAALRRDVRLFERLLMQTRDKNGTGNEVSLSLKGLGYFLPDGPTIEITRGAARSSIEKPHSSAILSLQDRIRLTHGEQFLEEKRVRAEDEIRTMEFRSTPTPSPALSREACPPFVPSVSTRYETALLAFYALEVLTTAPPLGQGTWWTSDGNEFVLDQRETRVLQSFKDQLEGDLVRLANSSRGDWGLPFIVGMARLASIEASLSSGRLVFLDVFPVEDRQQRRNSKAEQSCLQAMKEDLREVFLRRREEFFAGGASREATFAALERAGNLLLETDRALATNSPPRGYPTMMFPSREARRKIPALPPMDETILEQELKNAQAAAREYATDLSRLYSYDLVRRNCVTEIFTVINHTMERLASARDRKSAPATTDPHERLKEESVQRLGGFVDASRGFTFIPFVSAGEVVANYGVVGRHARLSYRTERLSEMMGHESPLVVFLRESNTITSTVYRKNPADSPFLFFTNDVLPLRPLFGAFNLLTGLGGSLLGIATMPFEGPDRLLSGVRGMLFSLPELVFVNLRKGSMAYVKKQGTLSLER